MPAQAEDNMALSGSVAGSEAGEGVEGKGWKHPEEGVPARDTNQKSCLDF